MTIKQYLEMIKKDEAKKKGKYLGEKYYYYKPKKYDESIDMVDRQGNIKTKKQSGNVYLYTNYFRLLVDQKVDYLLLKPPSIDFDDEGAYTINKISQMIEEMTHLSSLNGRYWLHYYVRSDTSLSWTFVHDREIIPIYDNFGEEIQEIIRYTKKEDIYYIEHWTIKGVTKLKIKDEKAIEETTLSHYCKNIMHNDILEKRLDVNFPFLPFTEMKNSRCCESDLEGIQELIDFYNQINSGYIDNIYKFQEALLKLKGFSGNKEVLRETMNIIQELKAVGVPDDGDVSSLEVQIPVEARIKLIEILVDSIFSIGRGYNPDKLGDGNITNVVIKNRYSGLDTKTSKTAKNVISFYEEFINNFNLYMNENKKKEIKFNKNNLINENEVIESCFKSIGMVSLDTIHKVHPYVSDPEKELLKMEEERKQEIENIRNEQDSNHGNNVE